MSVTDGTLNQVAPPSSEYSQAPLPVSAPVSAIPRASAFASTSLAPPAPMMSETKVPTAPTGAEASSDWVRVRSVLDRRGASCVPVMVTLTVRSTVLPLPSLSVMVKVSTLVWPAARYSTAEAATL